MNRFFIIFALAIILLTSPHSATAYETSLVAPTVPYEVITIDAKIEQKRNYLGELIGDPHMLEFALGSQTELKLTLIQKEAEQVLPLSLIIVKLNDNSRGVAEIGRVSGKATSSWLTYHDALLGLKLRRGETFTTNLGAGIYRVEVSTPENNGKYLLEIGTVENNLSYFSTLEHIRITQEFFGLPFIAILLSSYIFYPIGILLLLMLFLLTWRYKKHLSHA